MSKIRKPKKVQMKEDLSWERKWLEAATRRLNESFVKFGMEVTPIVRCRNCVFGRRYLCGGSMYCAHPENMDRIGIDGSVHHCDAYEVPKHGFCEKGVSVHDPVQ